MVLLIVPDDCCVTTYNILDELSGAAPGVSASITITYADGSTDFFDRTGLGPNNNRTFTIPSGRDPCSVRSIQAENAGQIFRITAVCCNGICD